MRFHRDFLIELVFRSRVRTYTVNSGLSGTFTGTDSLQADIYRSADNDEFDSWSQDRDRRDDSSRSARYVSHDVVGYEDLDDNGTWRSAPNYGDIWVPRVAA
jgi:cation transport regulator ChaB